MGLLSRKERFNITISQLGWKDDQASVRRRFAIQAISATFHALARHVIACIGWPQLLLFAPMR